MRYLYGKGIGNDVAKNIGRMVRGLLLQVTALPARNRIAAVASSYQRVRVGQQALVQRVKRRLVNGIFEHDDARLSNSRYRPLGVRVAQALGGALGC